MHMYVCMYTVHVCIQYIQYRQCKQTLWEYTGKHKIHHIPEKRHHFPSVQFHNLPFTGRSETLKEWLFRAAPPLFTFFSFFKEW